jgi:hypothetical protein
LLYGADDLHGRSISSLSVYPDRAKGYLLVLALPALADAQTTSSAITPANLNRGLKAPGKVLTSPLLKMYDLGTYRAEHTFPGVVINNSFCRATFSADGRYATCGTIVRSHDGTEHNHIRIWDTLTGRPQDTKIATLPYSFIPRSISWHPTQHVMAVAMVGHGAAVGIYCANKARAEDVVHDFNTTTTSENFQNSTKGKTTASSPDLSSSLHMSLSSPGRLRKIKRTTKRVDGIADGGEGSDNDVVEVRTKEQRAARTREILDKIKAAKARARGEQQM